MVLPQVDQTILYIESILCACICLAGLVSSIAMIVKLFQHFFMKPMFLIAILLVTGWICGLLKNVLRPRYAASDLAFVISLTSSDILTYHFFAIMTILTYILFTLHHIELPACIRKPVAVAAVVDNAILLSVAVWVRYVHTLFCIPSCSFPFCFH